MVQQSCKSKGDETLKKEIEECNWCNGTGDDGGGYNACPDCESTGLKGGRSALEILDKEIEKAWKRHLKINGRLQRKG